jgi:hypothetical protein
MLESLKKLSVLGALSALAASACTFTTGDGDLDDDSSVLDDDGSGSGSGSGGSNSTSSSSATGGGGDGPACIAPEGTGQTSASCDALPIAAYACDIDGVEYETAGFAACQKGFDIFHPGAAENLTTCLAAIPEAQACNDDLVFDCLNHTYGNVCENAYADNICVSIAEACSGWGEPFDAPLCDYELGPMHDGALDEMLDCFNTVTGTCEERYEICIEDLTATD